MINKRLIVPVFLRNRRGAMDLLQYSPAAYWKLDETSGVVATNYGSIASGNGAYTGVDLAQNVSPFTAPYFDGVNDFVNIYSAALNTSFVGGVGVLGSAVVFARVEELVAGTDAVLHIQTGGAASILNIQMATNVWQWQYKSAGTTRTQTTAAAAGVWVCLGASWTNAGNEIKFYKDGAQVGTTQASPGAWSGTITTTAATLGSYTTTPLSPFKGHIAHAAIFPTVLQDADFLSIYDSSGI